MSWFEEPRQPGWAEYGARVSVAVAKDPRSWPHVVASLAHQCGFDPADAQDVEGRVMANLIGEDMGMVYCRVPERTDGAPLDE